MNEQMQQAPPEKINVVNERQQVFTTEQIAELFQISKYTLEAWRRDGIGPKYYKPGKRVLYKMEDVQAFLEKTKISTTESL